MVLTHEQAKKITSDFFDEIGIDLLGKSEFLFDLLEDDDWSFVIKSHSLIEALITEIIINKISENELKELVQRMPLHGEPVSKIKMLKAYKMFSSEEITFIVKFSEIRNSIVHNYENINFTFDDFFKKLDKNNKSNWTKLLEIDFLEKTKFEKLLKEQPKYVVWFVLFRLIINFLEFKHRYNVSNKLNEAASETTSDLLKRMF